MILEKEEFLDKVFKSIVMDIMTIERSLINGEGWLDIGGHFYCVDGVRDILLEREGESLQYFLSDMIVTIRCYAEVYGSFDIELDLESIGFKNFIKLSHLFNEKFFNNWNSFVHEIQRDGQKNYK
ncbi:TPA: hypothetical protein ACIKV5_002281 [Streptococcus agalactiae]|uniref:hypothetical protein n=1 Tax=Bacillota TaxID=1239 RepID=UPI000DCBD99B|nr:MULTISPECIES: hypothetical protein [Bacillota]MDU5467182.1 hypothetical protein [Peptoniphilus harei]MED5861796.1 hypothetical protein [Streptococcus anginosus]HEN8213276.1 hypothetical protein [Streptococcus agalactiae]MDU5096960.1 hypothetical protein [Peptostreptococcus anaerobius]MED5961685.1 hypothetical protein [Streptococcus anginosus]